MSVNDLQEKKSKKKIWIIGLAIACVAALAAGIVFFFLGKDDTKDPLAGTYIYSSFIPYAVVSDVATNISQNPFVQYLTIEKAESQYTFRDDGTSGVALLKENEVTLTREKIILDEDDPRYALQKIIMKNERERTYFLVDNEYLVSNFYTTIESVEGTIPETGKHADVSLYFEYVLWPTTINLRSDGTCEIRVPDKDDDSLDIATGTYEVANNVIRMTLTDAQDEYGSFSGANLLMPIYVDGTKLYSTVYYRTE